MTNKQKENTMFLEVYAIPTNKWTDPAVESKVPENRRLIDTTGIRVRYSTKCKNRAEIVMPNGEIVHVVGTYGEVVERLESGASVARAD